MDDAPNEEQQAELHSSFASEEVEHIVDDHIAAAQADREAQRRKMEYIKFGVLAAILLGTVFVLAVSQPLVFGRIVPAVMGEGQSEDGAQNMDETMPETPPENSGEQAMPDDTDAQDQEQDGGAPDTSETQPENNEAIEQPTAVTGQIYVVQAGDTLNSIARQFNTSVEVITTANNIQNPDSLLVGTPLTIPQP